MNQIEGEAREILKPMMRGRHLLLDVEEQVVLRAWILLRGMILNHGVGGRRFYTREELLTFADTEFEGSLEPIDGTYIWLFQYRSPKWIARSNVANMDLHADESRSPYHLQLTTAFVGQFGFQILLGRWPNADRRLQLKSKAVREWESAMTLLWPVTDAPIAWPPAAYVHDDVYEPLLDRFSTPGFPLQKRPV